MWVIDLNSKWMSWTCLSFFFLFFQRAKENPELLAETGASRSNLKRQREEAFDIGTTYGPLLRQWNLTGQKGQTIAVLSASSSHVVPRRCKLWRFFQGFLRSFWRSVDRVQGHHLHWFFIATKLRQASSLNVITAAKFRLCIGAFWNSAQSCSATSTAGFSWLWWGRAPSTCWQMGWPSWPRNAASPFGARVPIFLNMYKADKQSPKAGSNNNHYKTRSFQTIYHHENLKDPLNPQMPHHMKTPRK